MIQFLHSGLQGAPSNIINAGSMCAIADDCLVNGFNVQGPLSVTVSAGVATLVYAAPHGHTADQYMRVLGASVSQVNGDKRPTILTTTTLTVPAPGAPDGPVGGSVSTRFAPLGWQQVFTDLNVRVYRSPNIQSSGLYYQLRDVAAVDYSAAWRGFESMTDANTGVGPFPTTAQVPQGQRFLKSASATPRPWVVVGDDRSFYFFTTDGGAEALYPIHVGEFDSHAAANPYNGLITLVRGNAVDTLAMGQSSENYITRDATQVAGARLVAVRGPFGFDSGSSGVYPSPVSLGALFARPAYVRDGNLFLGTLRGLMHFVEPVPAWPFSVLPSVSGVVGRVLCLMAGSTGRVALPLDEPW